MESAKMRRLYWVIITAILTVGGVLIAHSFTTRGIAPVLRDSAKPGILRPVSRLDPFAQPPVRRSPALNGPARIPSDLKSFPSVAHRAGVKKSRKESTIVIQPDPMILVGGKRARLQVQLPRAATTETIVALKTDSAILTLPDSIVVPAGHIVASFQIQPGKVRRPTRVSVIAATTDSEAAASRSILTIHPNN